MSKWCVVIIALFMTSHALANDAQKHDMVLIGEAKLKWLFVTVYKSQLYAESEHYQAGKWPKELKIDYLVAIKREKLIKQTRKEWIHLGLDKKQINTWTPYLAKSFRDICKGDVMSFYVSRRGVGEFRFNGKVTNRILDNAFNQAFMSIWLSENTSRPKLRKKLIGG